MTKELTNTEVKENNLATLIQTPTLSGLTGVGEGEGERERKGEPLQSER